MSNGAASMNRSEDKRASTAANAAGCIQLAAACGSSVELDRRDDAPATKRWEAARRRRRHGALFTRRDAIGEKHSMPQDAFVATIGQELADYGDALWRQALDYRRAQTLGGIRDFAALVEHFRSEGSCGFVYGKWSSHPGIDAKTPSWVSASAVCWTNNRGQKESAW